MVELVLCFFFSSRRRHTRYWRDWSSDVCSSDLQAEREVIVCGGAYNSPHLLTLSGIGRPDELELLQIELVAESPEVGMNLQDHPTAGVTYFCEEESSLKDALNDRSL